MSGAFLQIRIQGGTLLTAVDNMIMGTSGAFFAGLSLWCAYNFHENLKRRNRWVLIAPWFFGIGFALHDLVLLPFADPDPSAYSLFFAAWAVALLGVGTGTYMRTDLIGRRQIKWILYGIYISIGPYTIATVGWHLFPEEWLYPVAAGVDFATAALPICFLVAAFGYRFLDINPLISATASYSILAVVLLAGLLAGVPTVAQAASTSVGIDPTAAQVVLALVLAAVVVPAHRVLRPRLDAFFFPERRSLDEGIHHLLESLSGQRDPRALTAVAGERLDTQFRPESCVVYALAGTVYEPVFAQGKTVPPAVEAESPLITTLQARTAPLAADRISRSDRIEQLSLFDRAALDTLGAAVVVPVQQGGQLAAFLCMGPKRSGDIYTSTDLALLTAVANAVSTQLERMDQEQITREARAMQQELRRYVPGAVSREVEAGEDLEARERTVSVLFVDIRGYTTYSEARQAHEIFSTVNRFTQAVSAVIEKLGGSVVEFSRWASALRAEPPSSGTFRHRTG
jgi:GAF domain-containing protein